MSTVKSERIRELRELSGLTQKQFADKIGLSESTVGMLESGKREGTRKNIEKIASFFNVSVDYIEGREIKKDLFKDFLYTLIDEGIIDEENNIPPQIAPIILNNVQQYIERLKKEKRER